MEMQSKQPRSLYFDALSFLSIGAAIFLAFHLRKTINVIAFSLAVTASISATVGAYRQDGDHSQIDAIQTSTVGTGIRLHYGASGSRLVKTPYCGSSFS